MGLTGNEWFPYYKQIYCEGEVKKPRQRNWSAYTSSNQQWNHPLIYCRAK